LPRAAAQSLGLVQVPDDRMHVIVGVEADDEVDEILALEPHRTIAIRRGTAQRRIVTGDRIECPPQVRERLDIAASRDQDLRHARAAPPA